MTTTTDTGIEHVCFVCAQIDIDQATRPQLMDHEFVWENFYVRDCEPALLQDNAYKIACFLSSGMLKDEIEDYEADIQEVLDRHEQFVEMILIPRLLPLSFEANVVVFVAAFEVYSCLAKNETSWEFKKWVI